MALSYSTVDGKTNHVCQDHQHVSVVEFHNVGRYRLWILADAVVVRGSHDHVKPFNFSEIKFYIFKAVVQLNSNVEFVKSSLLLRVKVTSFAKVLLTIVSDLHQSHRCVEQVQVIMNCIQVLVANSLQDCLDISVLILVVDVPFLPKIVPFVGVLKHLLIVEVVEYENEDREPFNDKGLNVIGFKFT